MHLTKPWQTSMRVFVIRAVVNVRSQHSIVCGMVFDLGQVFRNLRKQLFLRDGWSLAKSFQPMAQAQEGMQPKHARTRVAHDDFNLLAPGFLVTVDRAFCTSGFGGAKTAVLQAGRGIFQ